MGVRGLVGFLGGLGRFLAFYDFLMFCFQVVLSIKKIIEVCIG